MSARTKARKRALDMLFQADVLQRPLAEVVAAEAKRAQGEPDRLASWLYAREIVDGVRDHLSEIDDLLASYALGWTVQRMPHLDRAILRIASWEMLHNSAVPTAVAINEAVQLANDYSTADSGRFINGVLGRIAEYAAQ